MRVLYFVCLLLGPGWHCCAGAAQPVQLNIARAAGVVQLGLQGETGRDYLLQANSDLSASGSWISLLTLTLTNSPQIWRDAEALAMPYRFYRLVKLGGPVPVQI